METHALPSVLPEKSFPEEKYSVKRFHQTEDEKDIKQVEGYQNKERTPLTFSNMEAGNPSKSKSTSRTGVTHFKGREVVFVDPLDDSADYWWPAMIVPPAEIDRSMLSRKLEQDECLVRYFEDNKFSICKNRELTLFQPGKSPFKEFSDHESFLNDPGVVIALNYIQTGELSKKFMWKLWGKDMSISPISAQPSVSSSDQENEGTQHNISDPSIPQRKQPQEQSRSSDRKRKKTNAGNGLKVHGSQEQSDTLETGKQKSPNSHDTDEKRSKLKKNSPAPSRTPSVELSHSSSDIVDCKLQYGRIESMSLKEISKRMKALRKEYRKIRRAVSRIAKELVVHKAGDGRITRSMMRRKR